MNIPHQIIDQRIPIERRGHYPGLGRADTAILDLHMRHCPPSFTAWYFDIPLGPLESQLVNAPWVTRYPAWLRNYSHRADLVWTMNGEITVCEIKPLAGPSALGQAIVYAHLWDLEYPDAAPARPCVMTDHTWPWMRQLCERLAIRLLELPKDVLIPHPTIAVVPDHLDAATARALPGPADYGLPADVND